MSRRRSGSLAVALVLGAVGTAQAIEVVPYSGFLDRDGAPVDGSARLRFRMYANEGAPVAPAQDPCDGTGQPQCIWAEDHPQVAVHNGAFTVKLGRPAAPGQARDIAPALRRKTPLFIEVAVFDQGRADFTILGRQEIHPAPQAVFTLQPDIEVDTLTATTVQAEVVHTTVLNTAEANVDADLRVARLIATTVDAAGTTFTGGVTLAAGSELTVNALPFKGLKVGHDAIPARGIPAWNGQITSSQDCFGALGNCPTSTVLPVVDPARAFCTLTLAGTFEVRESVNWMCAVYRSAEPGTPWKLDKRQINNGDVTTQVGCQATCLEW